MHENVQTAIETTLHQQCVAGICCLIVICLASPRSFNLIMLHNLYSA